MEQLQLWRPGKMHDSQFSSLQRGSSDSKMDSAQNKRNNSISSRSSGSSESKLVIDMNDLSDSLDGSIETHSYPENCIDNVGNIQHQSNYSISSISSGSSDDKLYIDMQDVSGSLDENHETNQRCENSASHDIIDESENSIIEISSDSDFSGMASTPTPQYARRIGSPAPEQQRATGEAAQNSATASAPATTSTANAYSGTLPIFGDYCGQPASLYPNLSYQKIFFNQQHLEQQLYRYPYPQHNQHYQHNQFADYNNYDQYSLHNTSYAQQIQQLRMFQAKQAYHSLYGCPPGQQFIQPRPSCSKQPENKAAPPKSKVVILTQNVSPKNIKTAALKIATGKSPLKYVSIPLLNASQAQNTSPSVTASTSKPPTATGSTTATATATFAISPTTKQSVVISSKSPKAIISRIPSTHQAFVVTTKTMGKQVVVIKTPKGSPNPPKTPSPTKEPSPPRVPPNYKLDMPKLEQFRQEIAKIEPKINYDKNRRGRHVFSAYETEALERQFAKCKYTKMSEKQRLARSLNLSQEQVKVWFQNRRIRDKKKEEKATMENTPPTSETESCTESNVSSLADLNTIGDSWAPTLKNPYWSTPRGRYQ